MKKTIVAILLASSFALNSQAMEFNTIQVESEPTVVSEAECKDQCRGEYYHDKRACLLVFDSECLHEARENFYACSEKCEPLVRAHEIEEVSL